MPHPQTYLLLPHYHFHFNLHYNQAESPIQVLNPSLTHSLALQYSADLYLHEQILLLVKLFLLDSHLYLALTSFPLSLFPSKLQL